MNGARRGSGGDGRFERGLEIRREVLGDEYVERSLRSATDFNRPLQELVTEYCWGAVWGRPGLDRHTRSLLNLGMLAAINHQHELATHVQGALRNGATIEEIREVLLQATIYCGVPAGVDAFRTATAAIEAYEAAAAAAAGDGEAMGGSAGPDGGSSAAG
jgi:4-carboxymuconolactone decarboxylase